MEEMCTFKALVMLMRFLFIKSQDVDTIVNTIYLLSDFRCES